MTFVDALGTGTYLAGSIVFFTQALSLSATDVGLGLSLGAVVGILTSVPVGAIADRFGARWTLVAICAWRACGFACYAVIHGFWAFLILTCLLGVTGKAVMASVRQALVGRSVLPENRVRTMAVTQAMRNVGLGLGSLLAFSIVELGARTSYDFIVLLNAASFIAAGALAVAVREKNFPTQEPKPRGRATAALQNRGYVGLTLLNTVFLFNNSVLVIAMPLWALDHTSAPKAIVPVFLTVNTVLVALLQVRAAEWAKSIALAARSLMISGVLLAVAAALIAVASALPAAEAAGAMILGVIALTGCELLQVPASWQLSYSFAPDESLASYLGLFSIGSSTESAIGPYALTAGVIGAGAIGWGAFGAVICCAAMLIPVIVRRVPVPDDRTTAEAAVGLLGGCHSVSAHERALLVRRGRIFPRPNLRPCSFVESVPTCDYGPESFLDVFSKILRDRDRLMTVMARGEAGVVDIIGCLGNFSMLAMLLNTFQVDLKADDEPPFPDVRGFAKVTPETVEGWAAGLGGRAGRPGWAARQRHAGKPRSRLAERFPTIPNEGAVPPLRTLAVEDSARTGGAGTRCKARDAHARQDS